MSPVSAWGDSVHEHLARLQEQKARVAVEQVRKERGIDRFHDSGADSGALGEDEERDRAER